MLKIALMNKKWIIIPIASMLSVLAMLFFNACSEDANPQPDAELGTLRLIGRGYLADGERREKNTGGIPLLFKNGATRMNTLDLIVNVRDIWVSQDSLIDGGADNQKWIRIYEADSLQSWSSLRGPAVQLNPGFYRSIKIVFNNVFYRKACFASDTSRILFMKETMGSWTDACDDTLALAKTNYISRLGVFYMNDQAKLIRTQPNERFTGFSIREGKMTNLYWKMGDERNLSPYLFWFDWIDENGNGQWDCGTDRMDNFDQSPDIQPPVETMFTFIAEYE